MQSDGTRGWDDYAPFYDWENARTLGRRDVPFWRRVAAQARGPVLELGCGTGRILVPLARTGVPMVGVDFSEPMLVLAQQRVMRARLARPPALLRADIRRLPFRDRSFGMVLAPYGMVQSLVTDSDLTEALESASRVLPSGGRLGVDMVPDLPRWNEYRDRVTLKGHDRRGGAITLRETVEQDRPRGLTFFHQHYTRRLGRERLERHFSLVFRTLSVTEMAARLERAGFRVEAALGDYNGAPWDARADVWILLARRC
jgi:ubiquinone/menaquinone biosynthesis C-methylase UbiE